MEHKSEGICRFCLKKFSGAGIGRHLSACKARKHKNELELKKGRKSYKIYHIKISEYKWYWLHIEIPASATLYDLDEFLRGIWYVFECGQCGKTATSTCLECEEFVCDQCLDSHECGEEMMLNVVNSPRMGVCGYGGPDRVDDWTQK